MSRYNSYSSATGVGAGCFVMSIFVSIYFGLIYLLSFWTDRNLDFWFSYFKGVPVDIPQWISFLLTLLSPIAFVGNIIAELFKFAI